MSKIKRNLFAVALVFALLLTGLVALGDKKVSASAETLTYPPYNGGEPEKIVYISDTEVNYMYGFIRNAMPSSWSTRIETYVQTTDFFDFVNTRFASPDFLFQNSAVIFEMRSSYFDTRNIIDDQASRGFASKLEEIFFQLKASGCRIMFICDRDETYFYNLTNFLKYVDIHVNTDVFTVFADTIMAENEDDDGLVRNCDIIINKADKESIFYDPFIQYFLTCLRTNANNSHLQYYFTNKNTFEEELLYAPLNSDADTLNIHLHATDNELPGFIRRASENGNDGKNIIAVGASWNGNMLSWLSTLHAQIEEYPLSDELLVYFYDANPLSLIEVQSANDMFSDALLCYGWEVLYKETMPDMLYNFFMGYDLSQYNNWDGVCEVTWKNVEFSETGRLRARCQVHDIDI